MPSPNHSESFQAIFGYFNLEMVPISTIDVTSDLTQYLSKGTFILPKHFDFKSDLKEYKSLNIDPSKRKYLRITNYESINYICEDIYDYDITISLKKLRKHINIVYYIYLNPNSNWRGIISSQLLELTSYGILGDANLFIHITDTYGLLPQAEQLISTLVPFANISTSTTNQFEYPAIKLIYELSLKFPSDIFIYFHSKGMSYDIHSRNLEEMTIFSNTFKNWRKNIQLFKNPLIQKIGLFPAIGYNHLSQKKGTSGGWIWYNFWYATGKYLSTCEPPIITSNRFYYEDWLARSGGESPQIANDCKNLFELTNANKTHFTPNEALYYLTFLMNEEFKSRLKVKSVLIVSKLRFINFFLKAKSLLKTSK